MLSKFYCELRLYKHLNLLSNVLLQLSLTGQEDHLDDELDSENLADFVGARLAYAAYASLPEDVKRMKLAGFDMSPEKLFFINQCSRVCAWSSIPKKHYAPFRSRCIVPLRNMPEFSRAFRCKAGTLMNPRNKCTFW
ncbi:hypothetical protein HPB51_029034 [Rhipicephalus microplus]|uniref:Peptidase M13 C-terminal domain-containing protein n=1 Tax=Rhipicephalus microplus TaxID=6941 RepID=A0A9J6CW11_RHIMP|nr:hypothetical protein HPB51_029034 [Rhipicephalus microplus]